MEWTLTSGIMWMSHVFRISFTKGSIYDNLYLRQSKVYNPPLFIIFTLGIVSQMFVVTQWALTGCSQQNSCNQSKCLIQKKLFLGICNNKMDSCWPCHEGVPKKNRIILGDIFSELCTDFDMRSNNSQCWKCLFSRW